MTDVQSKQSTIADMSEREIAEETLTLLRSFREVLEAFGNHPMAKMIPGLVRK